MSEGPSAPITSFAAPENDSANVRDVPGGPDDSVRPAIRPGGHLAAWVSRKRTVALGVLLATAVVIAAIVLAVPSLQWRVHLLALHALGSIPEVSWRDVAKFLGPGSGGYDNLARMIETRNPHPVVGNPFATSDDLQAGRDVFRERCVGCHGANGSGGVAPALAGRELKHGASDRAVYRAIQYGIEGTGMQLQHLSFTQTWQVAGYVRSLEASSALHQQQQRSTAVNVPYEAIKDLQQTGEEWLTFSGTYSSQRHSALTQITPDNVNQLSAAWIHQFDGQPFKIEASPLVRNGVMFMTVPEGQVLAIDARSGKLIWKYTHKHKAKAAGGEFGVPINRGVALLGDKVFVGTGDARLLALDIATGKLVWSVAVEQPEVYFISAAPLAFKDLVVTGVGTRQVGRGVIVAYEAETGKERWRFTSIPESGKPGNETWSGDSWRTGGAPTWMTGSYDVERDILVWGVGNPKPDYDTGARKGDNLYSNSAIALRGSTGELLWHFQFTPHDNKDWDANQVPMLVDLPGPSGAQPSVLWANRNGFYYVLDRLTGRYITSKAFVHQNWTGPISKEGRPQVLIQTPYKHDGQLIFPGQQGGTNWWPPTYSPKLNLVYVSALEQGMLFYPSAKSWPRDTGKTLYTAVRALDPGTGELVWEMRNPPRHENSEMSGLLSTATGVLFGGDQAMFFALNAETGQSLWSMQTGGKVASAPVTYMLDGVQYVTISAGRNLIAYALSSRDRAQTKAPAR